jgi:hypothetical protein
MAKEIARMIVKELEYDAQHIITAKEANKRTIKKIEESVTIQIKRNIHKAIQVGSFETTVSVHTLEGREIAKKIAKEKGYYCVSSYQDATKLVFNWDTNTLVKKLEKNG